MSNQTSLGQRMCPLCGARSDSAVCPADGQTTVRAPSKSSARIGGLVGGRYRVVELLGRGGFGDVYKAFHVGTHESVALKVLRAELHGDPHAIDRFTAEARMSASLKHPNTVRVFDFGTTPEGDLFLAMEFLDGESLEVELEAQGSLEPRRAVRLIAQVLKSLAEAHRKQIIHRDLKPENIFVCELAGEKDFVRVIDFGIAKFLRDQQQLTQAGAILGTPHCMSPEQIRAEPLDGRSDLYAVGVVLYRCLTGRWPFDSENAFAVLAGHLGETAPPPQGPGIDAALQSVVGRALEKSRDRRYADADAMRHALEAWAETAPEAALADADPGSATQAMDIVPGAAATAATAGDHQATMAMAVVTPERLRQELAALPPTRGRKRAPDPAPSAPSAVAPVPNPVQVREVLPHLAAGGTQPRPRAAPAIAPGGDATRVGLEAMAEPSRRVAPAGSPAADSSRRPLQRKPVRPSGAVPAAQAATMALDVARVAEAIAPAVTRAQADTVHEGRAVPPRKAPSRNAVLGAGLALLLVAGVATGVMLAGLAPAPASAPDPAPAPVPAPAAAQTGAPTAAAAQPRPAAASAALPAAAARAEPKPAVAAAPPPPAAPHALSPAKRPESPGAGPGAAQPGVTAGHARSRALARPTAALGSARPAATEPDAGAAPCSVPEGSREWCVSCPEARRLPAKSKFFCGCKEARGEADGLAWYCECRLPQEPHARGSAAWCKCHGGDPACEG